MALSVTRIFGNLHVHFGVSEFSDLIFERQWHQWMAVLTTNALVAHGSCSFVGE
jgi:uncharacterized membrane protein YhiD involved in acid resistance